MRIKNIELDGEERPDPIGITADLTIEEAVFIAKLVGDLNDTAAEEVIRGGGDVYGEIYNAIAGHVINRFYDGGLADWNTLK